MLSIPSAERLGREGRCEPADQQQRALAGLPEPRHQRGPGLPAVVQFPASSRANVRPARAAAIPGHPDPEIVE